MVLTPVTAPPLYLTTKARSNACAKAAQTSLMQEFRYVSNTLRLQGLVFNYQSARLRLESEVRGQRSEISPITKSKIQRLIADC